MIIHSEEPWDAYVAEKGFNTDYPTCKQGNIILKESISRRKDVDFVAITDDYQVMHTYVEDARFMIGKWIKIYLTKKLIVHYKVNETR